jgi:hypothetical protein
MIITELTKHAPTPALNSIVRILIVGRRYNIAKRSTKKKKKKKKRLRSRSLEGGPSPDRRLTEWHTTHGQTNERNPPSRIHLPSQSVLNSSHVPLPLPFVARSLNVPSALDRRARGRRARCRRAGSGAGVAGGRTDSGVMIMMMVMMRARCNVIEFESRQYRGQHHRRYVDVAVLAQRGVVAVANRTFHWIDGSEDDEGYVDS